jgi:hypothetical protein
MLNGTGVPVRKRYVVDGQAFYYRNAQHPGSPLKDVVQVYYQFKNEERAGLGMPMPAGVVRVYQADSKGGRSSSARTGSRTRRRTRTEPQDRQRLRRRLRAQADGLPEDRVERLRDRVRDHAAQPQGDADRRRGQRADRRNVADVAVVTSVDQDRRVGRGFNVPVRAMARRC